MVGAPENWQIWHQPPATAIMEGIVDFHTLLVAVVSLISLLVLGLLVYVAIRFNSTANPTPTRTAHNTVLEVAWTVLPVLVLIVFAIPSFRLLFEIEADGDAELTLKVTGRQWYWDYEFPDQGVSMSSYMVADEEIEDDGRRVLDVDEPVVLPVGTEIRVLLTAGDVIHAWGIPALGVMRDAVPGRVNQVTMRIVRPGTYYGQCRELCGSGHPFMPAVVRAVSREEFDLWIAERQAMDAGGGGTDLASAATSTGELQP